MEKKKCVQCGKVFTITDSEKQFYENRNFNIPKRCKECREKNKPHQVKTNSDQVILRKEKNCVIKNTYLILAGYFNDNDADELAHEPLMKEYLERYPKMSLYLRGDSGFACPKLFHLAETNGISYAIRLKANKNLYRLAKNAEERLAELTSLNKVDHAVVYEEFMYQAGSWEYPRRVVLKIEKPYNQFTYQYAFIVTNMELKPEDILRFYCNRKTMENFIKESKNGFDFSSTSSHDKTENANRLQLHALAYNLFNWFRRLVLPKNMRKMQIDTIRLKLIKIASRVIRSARYLVFKRCSSCPYQEEFYEIMENIRRLPQLE